MTPAMIAAQEQRLTRIAQLTRLHGSDHPTIRYLADMIRKDARR